MKFAQVLSLLSLMFYTNANASRTLNELKCECSGKSMIVEQCETNGKKSNIVLQIKQPLMQIIVSSFHYRPNLMLTLQVHIRFLKLEGSNYRSIFKMPKFEWCAFMGTKGSFSSRNILSSVLPSIPDLLHKCPYSGTLDMKNIEMSSKTISIFPVGNYLVLAKATNANDVNIINVSVNFTIF